MADEKDKTTEEEAADSVKVQHDYHDYAHELELEQSSATLAKLSAGGRGDQNFPIKLHYMLSELEKDGLDHIVSWQPHGRCFVVHKQKEFVDHVLPLWFRQSKFPSFQRQLNLYGFKRLTTGPDKGGYYHELFLRGKGFLAYRIQRIKIKGTGARKPSSPETEPNFYMTPYLPPTKALDRNRLVPRQRLPFADAGVMPAQVGGHPGANNNAISLQQLLLNYPIPGAMPSPSPFAQFQLFSQPQMLLEQQKHQQQQQLALQQHALQQHARTFGTQSMDALSNRALLAGMSSGTAAAGRPLEDPKLASMPGLATRGEGAPGMASTMASTPMWQFLNGGGGGGVVSQPNGNPSVYS